MSSVKAMYTMIVLVSYVMSLVQMSSVKAMYTMIVLVSYVMSLV